MEVVKTTATTPVEKNVARVKEQVVYNTDTEAFAHWFMAERFGLTGSDVQETLLMAGATGKGIDAVYFDDEASPPQINVVQFHYKPHAGARFGKGELAGLQATLDHLQDETLERPVSQPLADVLKQVHERRNSEYGVVLYVVVWGEFEKESLAKIRAINDANQDLPILTLDKSQVVELLPSLREIPEIEAEIPAYNQEHMEHVQDGKRSLIMTVRAEDVGALRRDFGDALFAKNVRYHLGNKGANKGMLDSLRTPDGKQNFWFYHNGITGICDRYEVIDGVIRAYNLQIVNGCQTTVTLDDAMHLYENHDQVPTLLMRLIETGQNQDFLTKISKFTNTQSAVTDQDLASNDRIQEHLQEAFRTIGWFYERARGEWKTLRPDELAEYTESDGTERKIVNSDAAKAVMIWEGMPAEAKSQKRQHFIRKPLGGYYETIFDPNRDVWEYLLAYLLMEYAEEQKKNFKATLRDAERSNFEGMGDEEKERLRAGEYLLHAETQVAAFLGYMVQQNVTSSHYSKVAKMLLEQNHDPIHFLFNLLDRIMTSYYKERLRSEGVQFSKYFKSRQAWPEFRSHLMSQMETLAAIGGQDPIEKFVGKLRDAGVPS